MGVLKKSTRNYILFSFSVSSLFSLVFSSFQGLLQTEAVILVFTFILFPYKRNTLYNTWDVIWVTKRLQGHGQSTFLHKDGLLLKKKLSENSYIKAAWQKWTRVLTKIVSNHDMTSLYISPNPYLLSHSSELTELHIKETTLQPTSFSSLHGLSDHVFWCFLLPFNTVLIPLFFFLFSVRTRTSVPKCFAAQQPGCLCSSWLP